ncbi:hypothetical protein PPL_01229 [Heterostelium album PN500]|uniref:Uncharacterized protein n=1 Tax=Heterostelium pallidum (strain ATCC 26659 / Pp 5 / PN500) TaxID=670386 RepID=D3AYG9_HETP5|nr:hypothetical protein PPL_01229 [Heterostelium album PN500]EFA85996.1 hypothetical protein PPL_01229 [Heterostelium album PN500]|eukprot:XP_020438102.1 hypothetical protein PPL_01229 [Heterostelium album PN500]
MKLYYIFVIILYLSIEVNSQEVPTLAGFSVSSYPKSGMKKWFDHNILSLIENGLENYSFPDIVNDKEFACHFKVELKNKTELAGFRVSPMKKNSYDVGLFFPIQVSYHLLTSSVEGSDTGRYKNVSVDYSRIDPESGNLFFNFDFDFRKTNITMKFNIVKLNGGSDILERSIDTDAILPRKSVLDLAIEGFFNSIFNVETINSLFPPYRNIDLSKFGFGIYKEYTRGYHLSDLSNLKDPFPRTYFLANGNMKYPAYTYDAVSWNPLSSVNTYTYSIDAPYIRDLVDGLLNDISFNYIIDKYSLPLYSPLKFTSASQIMIEAFPKLAFLPTFNNISRLVHDFQNDVVYLYDSNQYQLSSNFILDLHLDGDLESYTSLQMSLSMKFKPVSSGNYHKGFCGFVKFDFYDITLTSTSNWGYGYFEIFNPEALGTYLVSLTTPHPGYTFDTEFLLALIMGDFFWNEDTAFVGDTPSFVFGNDGMIHFTVELADGHIRPPKTRAPSCNIS